MSTDGLGLFAATEPGTLQSFTQPWPDCGVTCKTMCPEAAEARTKVGHDLDNDLNHRHRNHVRLLLDDSAAEDWICWGNTDNKDHQMDYSISNHEWFVAQQTNDITSFSTNHKAPRGFSSSAHDPSASIKPQSVKAALHLFCFTLTPCFLIRL